MIFLMHGKDSSEKSLTLNSFLKIIPNEEYFFITYASNKSYQETVRLKTISFQKMILL